MEETFATNLNTIQRQLCPVGLIERLKCAPVEWDKSQEHASSFTKSFLEHLSSVLRIETVFMMLIAL
jgi:hypothetical protein